MAKKKWQIEMEGRRKAQAEVRARADITSGEKPTIEPKKPKETPEEYDARLTAQIAKGKPTLPVPKETAPTGEGAGQPASTSAEPEIGQPAESAEEKPRAEENPEETREAEESSEEEAAQEEQAEKQDETEDQNQQEQAQQEDEEEAQKEQAEEQTRLKFTDRIKKSLNDAKKKLAETGDNIKKKITKEAIKKILLALISNPYFWAVVGIIILLMVIASSCSRQSGKTPTQPLDKVADKNLVLQLRSYGGEKAAQREWMAEESLDAKKMLAGISTTNPEAQKIIEQINKLLDEMVALTDSEAALKERIKQILDLLEQLKKLLPDSASKIDEIKNKVTGIGKWLDFFKVGAHVVLNPKDLDYVRNFDVDRRIVQMLVYLATPVDLGGAGYERLKVKRIKFSYDSERKWVSKETDSTDKEQEPVVSAHFSGQAADITEIDCIKCTQIKRRRVGSDKKTKLPPIPIKVAWQTEKGYMQAGGPEAFGENMHQVFNNLGGGATYDFLIQQVSDILGVDIDPEKLKGKTLPEIARYIGIALLKETLDIPGDYELGDNLGDISRNVGRAYLAEALGVPIEGIQGNTEDEIMENIGRAVIEEKMALPSGSLAGNSSSEIFASAGKRKMEEALQLARGTLSISFNDSQSFRRVIGQGRVEAALGIKPQTFYGNIDEFKKRVGKDLLDYTFANPEMIDNSLGLTTGMTEKMLNNQISIADYNIAVGDKVYANEFEVYKDSTKRAEAFGIASSDLKSLLNGNAAVFVGIGKTVITKTLAVDNKEQSLILSWFNTKQLPLELDEEALAGQLGLKEGDVGKIFVSDLGGMVFHRVGQVELLDNLTENPELNPYLQPVKDLKFYTDRLHTIKDNLKALEGASDSEIRAKAAETRTLVNNLLDNPSISNIRKNIKQIQTNIKFMEDRALTNDPDALKRIKTIRHALDEIIEGKTLTETSSLDESSIKSKTDPQIGLTKKDILALITGKKTVDDLAYSVGLRKWEVEFDLPEGSLKNAYDELKKNNFTNVDDTLLISIGKAKVKERGGIGGTPENVDKDLGLPKGTTADFKAGKITENAYYKKVGMGVNNSIAAGLLNQQLDLTGDPNYALQGKDITNLLGGGWFFVALKVGGRAIDEAMGFPAGGTLDIIQQTDQPGDVLGMLAEKKLGLLAGLDRSVSINGDIPYNLGRAQIEQYLGLKPNELNDGNLVEKVKGYTGSDKDSLSRLDMTFGLAAQTSKKLLSDGIAPHEYITKAGNYLRDSVIYDQIALYAPELKDKDLKNLVLALAEKTGSPQDILAEAGARQVGEVLGLDYPVSIRGNFKDNLGQAKIENRLGFKNGTFRDNIDAVIKANSQAKFEAAFYIDSGKLSQARDGGSDYWKDQENKTSASLIDTILDIPSGSTFDFLTGKIDLAGYVARVGSSSLKEVSVDKLADLMDLDDKYKEGAQALISVFNRDPHLESNTSKVQVFEALMNVGGLNLDNATKFDPGTWAKILFTDPKDPNHTGPKHAGEIILEQGKKWLPRWMGMAEKWDPYIDLIYEQASGIRDEQEMIKAIKQITGIPDDNNPAHDADARRFLNGDWRGALTVWGAAQITQMYNEEFKDTTSRLDYDTVKQAYFHDPADEKLIGDAAVKAIEDKIRKPLSADAAAEVRKQAISEAREKANKNVMYAAIDMQLHKIDKNIPPGFSEAMREGTAEQRWGMGLTYLGNLVHSQNSAIPAALLPELQKYFDPSSPLYHKQEALSSATYTFLDQQMKTWFGDFIQAGTAKALLQFGESGQLGQPNEKGTLGQIYADYGINIVTGWADKTMGLPMGTTKMIYEYFTKYQQALAEYKAAYEAYYMAETAEQATVAAENLIKKEQALDALKAAAITWFVTTAFQKQLLAVDQSLGLVPGSSAMLVGMAVQYWITGAVSPWSIGIFVLTNLFGVYRIDLVCTACGYYPEMGGAPGTLPFKTGTTTTNGKTCPLGEFDGKSSESFKTNSMQAAQWKVESLIGDVLQMPVKLKDNNLLPTQVITYRQEDVDNFSSELTSQYGPAGLRMNSGLWANEVMWGHIHIGY